MSPKNKASFKLSDEHAGLRFVMASRIHIVAAIILISWLHDGPAHPQPRWFLLSRPASPAPG